MEKEGTLYIKFVVCAYYSGHGEVVHGTQVIILGDGDEYPLEAKMRNFKNDHI